MLYLTSNGITSKELISHFRSQCKGGVAAIITTASVGFKEKDKHIPSIVETLNSCSYDCRFFDIETDSPNDLMSFDLVYIIGGNPYYLLNQIKLNEFEDIFKRIYERRIPIVGASAGSMVLTENIGIVDTFDKTLNESVNLNDISAIGLVDFEICPHYKRFQVRFDSFIQRLVEYEQESSHDVYRINDGEAIFINEEGLTQIKNIN